MDLSIHRVRRLVITEKMETGGTTDHCFLIIQNQAGETLKIDLYDWNGEIANEPWTAGVFA